MKLCYLSIFALGIICVFGVSCTPKEDTRILPYLPFPREPVCELYVPIAKPEISDFATTEEYNVACAKWEEEDSEGRRRWEEYVEAFARYVEECETYPARNTEFHRQLREKGW